MNLTFREVHKIEKDFKKVPKTLKTLSLAFFIYTFSWGIIIPYFSIYINSIVPSYSQVGFIVALMPIIAAITAVVIGDLVDKVGRKKILLFSFVNYLIIGPLYTVTHSISIIAAARIYHGIAAVGIWVPSIAYVRDISPKNKRAEYMGYFYTASSISFAIGPLVGAVLVSFLDIKYMFYAVGIGALAAAAVTYNIPESIKPKKTIFEGIKEVFFKDKFVEKEIKDYVNEKSLGLKITMISFFSKTASSLLIMILALYINMINGSLWHIGVVYCLLYLPFVFQFAFGEIADHVGMKKMLVFGASISCIFFSALFFSNNIISILIFSFLGGLGLAIVAPVISSYISKMAKKNRGEVTGIYSGVDYIAGFTGPLVGGLVSDIYGLNCAFIFAALAMLFVVGVGLRIDSGQKSTQQKFTDV